MTKNLLAAFLLVPLCMLQAQEQLGIRLSNYGGINSTLLNPALHTATPLGWDVNLMEGAGHFSNDYAYLRNTRLTDLMKNPQTLEFEFGPDLPPGSPEQDGSIVVDFFRDGSRRRIMALGSVLGPSFFVQIAGSHRIGLITRSRGMLSGRGVADPFNYYDYNSRPFYEPFPVEPFRGAVAGWTEVGFNYAYQAETANGAFAVGITLKALQAYEGSYLRNASLFQFQKLPNDSIGGSPIDFSFGYTTSNLKSGDYKAERNGGGIAADLGVVFITYGNTDGPYTWKIGLSAIDIGRLNFRRNAEEHIVRTTEPISVSTIEYESFRGLNELEDYIQFFSEQSLGDSAASFSRAAFAIWLPAALGLQLDRHMSGPFFLGAAYTQGVALGPGALPRGSHLAVAPRLESRWLEAALPVSIYDWEEVRVGLAVRAAFLTIGTSHLSGFLRRSNLRTADLYFAIKISPLWGEGKGDGGFSRRDSKYRSGKRGQVRCYNF